MAGQSRLFCQSPSTCARYTHQAMYYPNQPNHTDRWLYQGVANPNPTHLPHRTTRTKADGEERTHKLPTHTKHGRAAQRGSEPGRDHAPSPDTTWLALLSTQH